MDASILNFLAIVSRNRENKFDLNLICSDKSKCHESEKLKEFSNRYSDVNSIDALEAHNEWANLVSGIENQGIKYVENKNYELETSVDNIFKILGHHLFPELKTDTRTSRSGKMDKLCALISRPGFEVDWKLVSKEGHSNKTDLDKNDKDVSLVFSINGEDRFRWAIYYRYVER